MTNENRCEPPKPWANGWHWIEKGGREICAYWWQTMERDWAWYGIGFADDAYRYLAPVTPPATVAALVEALKHADLQLEYIDQRSPSGTTPAVRAQIGAALALYREAGR